MILIHLDNLIVIFDFGHFQEVNWGQVEPKTLKTLGNFKKFRFFKNPLNIICTTIRTTCGQNFSSVWRCLLELLSPNSPPPLEKKVPNGVLNQKALLFLLGKVETKNYAEAKTWGVIYKFGPKNLLLKEFCDFSGTWDLYYLILIRMQFFCKTLF